MNRTKQAFENGKAFIPFITCGDPNLEITEKLVYAMEEAGADLIELGIPFSDPTAEGPVIQASSLRAFKNDITTDKIFEMVRKVRKNSQVPLAFMTYANVVFSYNIERFIKTMKEIGVDALIVPDVPFEEKDEFLMACTKYEIDFISLIAPTSKERVTTIASQAKGFVYCVSSLGVTGTRNTLSNDIGESIERIRKNSTVPCAIGFGISTVEQAKKMAALSDGVIVGSAIVEICGKYGETCVPHVKDFVFQMKEAIRVL
ncbi:tryptophan synthase subunit alpha [Carnobacterium sp. TMP28]|uniref:tryptophan synthase subunit alpha n=1 Tax=Carnobacterium sp. TMP28 TaxID=3397060 RepID=UPI0039E11BB4